MSEFLLRRPRFLLLKSDCEATEQSAEIAEPKERPPGKTEDEDDWGTNSEGQVKYCPCTFFGHPTPDRAGARPYRIQYRVARCDMGLPAHTSHPLSFRVFRGPHSLGRAGTSQIRPAETPAANFS